MGGLKACLARAFCAKSRDLGGDFSHALRNVEIGFGIPFPMVCPVLLLAKFRQEYRPFRMESDAFL